MIASHITTSNAMDMPTRLVATTASTLEPALARTDTKGPQLSLETRVSLAVKVNPEQQRLKRLDINDCLINDQQCNGDPNAICADAGEHMRVCTCQNDYDGSSVLFGTAIFPGCVKGVPQAYFKL